ncbi:MAG TPA: helix-turn-helix domain-containing protein [Anaerolineae bacterium]|nr:helix-turn-helix domain-containing protein [Anaerolineae bacterium]
MPNLLTVEEAADMLRVSRSTVWRWCKEGTLKSAFKIGHTWRIPQEEIEDLMRRNLWANWNSPDVN